MYKNNQRKSQSHRFGLFQCKALLLIQLGLDVPPVMTESGMGPGMGGMATAWATGAVWIRNVCQGSREQPKDTLCKHGETGGGPAALLAQPDRAWRQHHAIASYFLGSQWSPVLAPQVMGAPGLRHWRLCWWEPWERGCSPPSAPDPRALHPWLKPNSSCLPGTPNANWGRLGQLLPPYQ